MKALFALLALYSTTLFASPDYAIKADCVKYLAEGQGLRLSQAASYCAHGVSKSCMEHMIETQGHRVSKASNYCANGVRLDCVAYVQKAKPRMHLNSIVNKCRHFVNPECLTTSQTVMGDTFNNSFNTCRGGVDAGCLDYVYAITGSRNRAKNYCR